MSAACTFARRALRIEKHPLALHAPAIAAELARAAHDAMTRDHQRNAIRCTCARHRTRRARLADRLGYFRVRADLAIRQLLQVTPHDQLECRAAHVERQIEPWLQSAQMPVERRHPRLELFLVRRGHRLYL